MYRCPNQKRIPHPPAKDVEYLVMANIIVSARTEFRSVFEHFFEDVICQTCGENVGNG